MPNNSLNVNYKLSLRKITLSDSSDIFQWRNNELSKQMSISTEVISWDKHSEWINAACEGLNNLAFIALFNEDEKIGICSFEFNNESNAQVSINLNPDFRGHRLSSEILSLSIAQFRSVVRKPLHASIKKCNVKSISIFTKCNFQFSHEDANLFHYILPKVNVNLDEKLKLIDEIQRIRSANNVNWMDLLRLAFLKAPEETKMLIRKINTDDNRISDLFAKLGE